MTAMKFTLEDAPPEAVELLDDLLLELHRHEGEVSPSLGAAPARPDDEYLRLYRSRFAAWLAGGDGFLIVAREQVDDSSGEGAGARPGAGSGVGSGADASASAGELVGFLFAVVKQGDTAYDTGERIGYLEEIAVLARARGNGVGRALIEEARRRFARRDVRFVKLSTVPGNDEARDFYARLGFSPAAILMIGEV